MQRSSACTSCSSSKFEIGDSSTFEYLAPAETDSVRYADGTELSGGIGTDVVCPVADANSCITKYHFAAIEQASGLGDREDGILGMWSGNVSDASSYKKRELFVPEMVKTSTITASVFSFHLSGLSG